MRTDTGAYAMTERLLPHAALAVELELGIPRSERGAALLKAISDGDVASLGALLTSDVRLTSFDRGDIHEVQGREAVCEWFGRQADHAATRFIPTGSRVADDAVFFWGGAAYSERPGWMITLFFRHDRFFDVRIYFLR